MMYTYLLSPAERWQSLKMHFFFTANESGPTVCLNIGVHACIAQGICNNRATYNQVTNPSVAHFDSQKEQIKGQTAVALQGHTLLCVAKGLVQNLTENNTVTFRAFVF